jgi:tRNA pseudouridine38-40 synthase
MNEAAQLFTLHRDFSSFCKSGGGQKTTICLVRRADWTCLENGQWKFEIVADRFLRNMVRAVVGTLLDVGRNKLTLSEFETIFDQNNRNAAGESVFAGGLFLSSVKYPYL